MTPGQLKIGNWVVVKFQMSEQVNRIGRFIGKIDAIDTEGKFMGDFLRPMTTNKNKYKLCDQISAKKDKTLFSLGQVERVLKDQKPFYYYGLLLLDINEKEFIVVNSFKYLHSYTFTQ